MNHKKLAILGRERNKNRGLDQIKAYVSPPIEEKYSLVLFSGSGEYSFNINETLIFALDENFDVSDFQELEGSRRGMHNPESLMKELGYEIVEAEGFVPKDILYNFLVKKLEK